MRTNIVLDDDLMRQAMAVSGLKTKKEVIHRALRLYVGFMKRKDLTELAGRMDLLRDYDHKEARELRR